MDKISEYLLSKINYLYLFFVCVTFFGAIRSSNLNVSELPSEFVLLLMLFVLFFLFLLSNSNLNHKLKMNIKSIFFLFKRYRRLFTIVIFVLFTIVQLIILVNVTTAIGWDVGVIISNVSDPIKVNEYLSVYPNNQLYFFMMYFYNKIILTFLPYFGGQWLTFQILNVVLIDTAAILLFSATKELFGEKYAYITLYLFMLLFMLSPWIMVPYTDQISLFLTTVVLYLYSNVRNTSSVLFYMTVIAIGMTIGISFLIKPSSIIYIISWTIVELIKKIKDSHFSFENIVVICLIIGSISLPIATFNSFINNQKIIQIDSNKAMPWTHFVMMGLKGNGGYNFNDVERDKKIIDPTLRKKSNVEEIKRRLAEYKVTGYVQFLTQKHFNNSDRGDFGWGKDGTPQIPETKSKNWFQTFLRDLYYQQGKKTNILRFYMQIIWIVIIFGLFFTFKSNLNSNLLSYIKLTIIGAFVYLLLFEGGRSRYLIQYLPFILILSSIGLAKFSIKDTRKMKWFVKEKNDF